MKTRLFLTVAALVTMGFSHLQAQSLGVIDDPDGFTNLRSKQSTSAPVVAKVNKGEVFEFEHAGSEPAVWVKVKLANGKTGWMHGSRVRFHATMDELSDSGPEDEINVWGRGRKIDYYPLARAAAKGDTKAMQKYFGIDDTDGAAAETHCMTLNSVIHLIGDERFAKFLSDQTPGYLENVREHFVSELTLWPFEPKEYLRLHFQKTSKVLLAK